MALQQSTITRVHRQRGCDPRKRIARRTLGKGGKGGKPGHWPQGERTPSLWDGARSRRGSRQCPARKVQKRLFTAS